MPLGNWFWTVVTLCAIIGMEIGLAIRDWYDKNIDYGVAKTES